MHWERPLEDVESLDELHDLVAPRGWRLLPGAIECLQRTTIALDWREFWLELGDALNESIPGLSEYCLWVADPTGLDLFRTRYPRPRKFQPWDLQAHPRRQDRARRWKDVALVGRDGVVAGSLELRSFDRSDWTDCLRLPLRDHHGQLRAIFLAARVPGPIPPADLPPRSRKAEAAYAALLAERVGDWIEDFGVFVAIDKMRRRIQVPIKDTFRVVLKAIFDEATTLFGADRGDFGFYDWDRNRFVLHVPEMVPPEQEHETRGPGRGLIQEVWDNGGPYVSPDIEVERRQGRYREHDSRTRSELLIRIDVPMYEPNPAKRRRVAVLNLESYEKDWFDDRDAQLLRMYVYHISEEFASYGKEHFYEQIIRLLTQPHGGELKGHSESDGFREIGKRFLDRLRDVFGFDGGILFRPDYPKQVLRAFAFQPPPDSVIPEDDLVYSFQEPSYAYQVFQGTGASFVPDVAHPPEGTMFNTRGTDRFRIKGPVVGVRISDHDGPVGVLVLWSYLNPGPDQGHVERLRPYAEVAALLLRVAEAGRRRARFQEHLKRILNSMRTTLDLKHNLELVIEAVRDLDFDSVRVFQFKYGNSMKGLLCSGMADHGECFVNNYLYNETTNPLYYKRFIENYRNDSLAQRYDPRKTKLTDPQAEELGKPPDLEWVAAPLVSGGKLYGELAADNRVSRRPITDDDLEIMNLCAALAARAFAIAEHAGMLRVGSLSLLYKHALDTSDEMLVWKRILRLATHGEEGLGFSRAIHFSCSPDGKDMRFHHGVGQVTHDDFASVAKETSRMSLEAVFLDAVNPCDEALYQRLTGRHDVEGELEALWAGLERRTSTSPTCLAHKVAAHQLPLLGGLLENEGTPFLLAPIRIKDSLRGVLVVDRAWQQQDIGEADQSRLWTLSQEAGQLLYTRGLQAEVASTQELAILGRLSRGLCHELIGPAALLKIDATYLRRHWDRFASSLERSTDQKLLWDMSATALQLADRIDSLEQLRRGTVAWESTDIGLLLDALKCDFERTMMAEGVAFSVYGPQNRLVVRLAKGLFLLGVENLIKNAVEALRRGPAGPPSIELEVQYKGTSLVVSVRDNGPGPPPHVLHQINSGELATSKPGHSMGFGLAFVRDVALRHQGSFRLVRGPGDTTLAELTLTVAP